MRHLEQIASLTAPRSSVHPLVIEIFTEVPAKAVLESRSRNFHEDQSAAQMNLDDYVHSQGYQRGGQQLDSRRHPMDTLKENGK